MSSSIVQPDVQQMGNNPAAIAQKLSDVAAAAIVDINGIGTTANLASTTPAAVAAAGAAGSATTASHSDHAHADPNRAVKGTNLTDTATQTIATPGTGWRTIGTLSQNGALTVGTTGAVAGDQLEIVRTGTDAYTYAVINGGVGAGTLATLPASKQGSVKIQFDGTNWAFRGGGAL